VWRRDGSFDEPKFKGAKLQMAPLNFAAAFRNRAINRASRMVQEKNTSARDASFIALHTGGRLCNETSSLRRRNPLTRSLILICTDWLPSAFHCTFLPYCNETPSDPRSRSGEASEEALEASPPGKRESTATLDNET